MLTLPAQTLWSQIKATWAHKWYRDHCTKQHCGRSKEGESSSQSKSFQSMPVVCCESMFIKLFFNTTKPMHCFSSAQQITESTATYLCTIEYFWLNDITSSTWHLIACHTDYTLEMKASSARPLISLMWVTILWSASTPLPDPPEYNLSSIQNSPQPRAAECLEKIEFEYGQRSTKYQKVPIWLRLKGDGNSGLSDPAGFKTTTQCQTKIL